MQCVVQGLPGCIGPAKTLFEAVCAGFGFFGTPCCGQCGCIRSLSVASTVQLSCCPAAMMALVVLSIMLFRVWSAFPSCALHQPARSGLSCLMQGLLGSRPLRLTQVDHAVLIWFGQGKGGRPATSCGTLTAFLRLIVRLIYQCCICQVYIMCEVQAGQ